MTNKTRIAVSMIAVLLLTLAKTSAQNDSTKLGEMMLSNSNLGYEYWIVIPPNELLPFPTNSLDVLVGSAYNTEITIYNASENDIKKRKITAGEVRTLTDRRGETNWGWEIRDYEKVLRSGVRLTADRPFSVYVLNSKVTTTDGYLAIPVSGWGTEYLVTSYYDFKEFSPWAGGFIVVAGENSTTVTIRLRGVGGSDGKTSGGKSLYDPPFTVTLDAGDVYMVKGDGKTRGVFDLTGTLVTSTKPVGLVSFHERTTMPNMLVNGNGRNHLCEMNTPTSSWGKQYVSLEFDRVSQNQQGRGDVFRVIARDTNTRWTLKYYDKVSKKLLGQNGGVISNAGGFVDIAQSTVPTTLTHGFAVWEADKPIFVVQYSCSASWDGFNSLDPFMVNVTPVEQFVSNAIVQTPSDSKFYTHIINMIVWADINDPDYISNLKSLTLNDAPVWDHPQSTSPTLLNNHMGNNLHWVTLKLGANQKSLQLKSNEKLKFGGMIYGHGDVDAYGWPIGGNSHDRTLSDTLPPVIISGPVDCGSYEFEATELRNIPNPPRTVPLQTDQVESGIAEIGPVSGQNSFNYMLEFITDQVIPQKNPYKRFKFRWRVIDSSQSARCVFYVRDWNGNVAQDTCEYVPALMEATPSRLDYGQMPLGTVTTKEIALVNSMDNDVALMKTYLKQGTVYSITSGMITTPRTFQARGTHTLSIRYDASRESEDAITDRDRDTLIVEFACTKLAIPLAGAAVVPKIEIEDYDAGYVVPGELACKSGGLKITNTGSDTLVVTRFTGTAASKFFVSPSALSALPYIIPPKTSYQMKDVCYQRDDMGTDVITVEFTSNATGPKMSSVWKATTAATSVDESGDNGMDITSASDGVHVSWTQEEITTIQVLGIRGELICTMSPEHGQKQVLIPSSVGARQTVVVSLIDSRGSVVQSRTILLQ